MEREGLLNKGDEVTVTEGVLPTSFYYTINPSLAMSGNFTGRERLTNLKGTVKSIEKRPRGYYVIVSFDE